MLQRSFRFILLPLVLVLCLLACSSDSEFNPIASSSLDPPRVSGLWVYSAGGAYLGSWGVPHIRTTREEVSGTASRQPLSVYPNPASKPMPSTTISFATPEPAHVWIWVVRAIGPSEVEAAISQIAGANCVRPGGAPVAVLMNDQYVEVGVTSVDWNLSTDPSAVGFYRVYLYAEYSHGQTYHDYFDMLYWIGGNCELAPADLRPYLYCDEQ
jgi:hypothetical protein